MRSLPRTVLGLLALGLFLSVVLGGCGGKDAGAEAFLVHGRLLDDETGLPVSRSTVYVHAFNDTTEYQVSLEPADSSEFSMRLPEPRVRLRVADLQDEYHLYEKTLLVPADGLEHEVRLVPTHYVRLRGRVLWRDGTSWRRSPSEADGNVRHVQVDIDAVGGFRIDEGGSYSVRVPRRALRFWTISTNHVIDPLELDLTGYEPDELRQDLHLVHA